jgi:hypothetical protein
MIAGTDTIPAKIMAPLDNNFLIFLYLVLKFRFETSAGLRAELYALVKKKLKATAWPGTTYRVTCGPV